MLTSFKQHTLELDSLKNGDHAGCFYTNEDESRALIERFINAGRGQRHKAVSIAQALPLFEECSGQEVSNALPCDGKSFRQIKSDEIPGDMDAFIALLNREIDKALEEEWKGVRLCLDMKLLPAHFLLGSSSGHFPGRLRALKRADACTILCLYDRKKLSADFLMQALTFHPLLISRGRLVENSCFHPKGQSGAEDLRFQVKELEDRYRFVFENTSDFLFFHDMDGIIKEMKLADKEVEGYTEQDLIGLNLKDLVPGKYRHEFGDYLSRIKENGEAGGIIRISSRKEGEVIFEFKSFLVSDETGPVGARGLAQNVSERFKAREALKKSEEKYRDLFNSVSDYIYFHDMEGNFDFEDQNEAMKKGWSYKEGGHQTGNIRDFIPAPYRHLFNEYMRRIKEKKNDVGLISVILDDGLEHVLEYKNNLIFQDGVPVKVRGIARDITDRIKTEGALRKSEERYRSIFNNVSDFLYFHDLEGFFNLEECNFMVKDNWTRIDDETKRSLRDILPERYRPFFGEYLRRILEKGKDEGPICVMGLDGLEHILEYKNSLVYGKDGNPIGIRGSAREITDRVSAERGLRKSEKKYRTILESIEEGYYEVDLQGNYTFLNDSFCRIIGHPKENLIGTSYVIALGEDRSRSIFKIFNNVLTTGRDVESTGWEFVRVSDGRKIYIEVSISRILAGDGECKGFRGMMRDVTHRVHAEKALMESEQRYRLLAENVKDIIWTADPDFNFTYLSPSVKQIAGATVEDALKLNIRHVMGNDIFTKIMADQKQILEDIRSGKQSSDTVLRFEFLHGRSDGTAFWADVITSIQFDGTGNPIGYIGVTRDITDRVNAEEEVKKSEAKYRSILMNMEEGYFETDLSGDILFFNDAVCRIIGYAREEIEGKNYAKFMDEENVLKIFETSRRIFETGIPEKGFGWALIRKDGSPVQVESSILLTRDTNEEVTGFRGVLRDITEKKQAEDLKAAKLKAEAENRAKSDFLANMSHEIRTPLNGIIGMAELALDMPMDQKQKDVVKVINRESEVLLSLINDVLDFSKIEADRCDLENIPFDLRGLIEDLAHSFAIRSEKKGLEFIAYVSPEVPSHLTGDPGRLRQVITNLAGNALKFTDKGEVFIHVEMEQDFGDRVKLLFSVKDTGIGIPEDKQKSIFDVFTQADGSTTRKYGGTGLGLAISKRIVELMGGSIGVESLLSKGSRFFFSAVFPRESSRESLIQTDHNNLKNLRVLVVDDNETSRFILMEYLKSWGCIPVDSPGGDGAIPLLLASAEVHEPFDLIIMDFRMPDIDGFELAGRIRSVESLNEIPIILLTTSLKDLGEEGRLKEIGIQGYLPKPARRDDLRKVVISVMGFAHHAGDQEKGPEPAAASSLSEDFRRNVRILMAEDYPTNQQIAMRHLHKAGYQVEIAENGEKAVSAFRQGGYDIILMDVQMPVIDGYEATKQIRIWEENLAKDATSGDSGVKGRVPIIAMTAHAMSGYRDKCIEAGMDDYLAKPLRREELLDMVDKWIRTTLGREKTAEAPSPEEKSKGSASTEKNAYPIDLEKAMNEFDTDREFMKELLVGFLENVGNQLEKIGRALENGDAETVRKEAHSIKGGAANLCADDLSRVALEMEMLGKSGRLDTGTDMLQRMTLEFDRLVEFDKNGL